MEIKTTQWIVVQSYIKDNGQDCLKDTLLTTKCFDSEIKAAEYAHELNKNIPANLTIKGDETFYFEDEYGKYQICLCMDIKVAKPRLQMGQKVWHSRGSTIRESYINGIKVYNGSFTYGLDACGDFDWVEEGRVFGSEVEYYVYSLKESEKQLESHEKTLRNYDLDPDYREHVLSWKESCEREIEHCKRMIEHKTELYVLLKT